MSDQKRKRQGNASSFRASRSGGSTGSINSGGDPGPGGGGGGGGQGGGKTSSKHTPDSVASDSTRNKSNQLSQSKHLAGSDNVRRIVQAEGRTARNLVTWSVPLDATDQSTKPRSSKQGSAPFSPPLKANRPERSQHRTPSDPRSVSSPRTPRQPRRGAESVQAKSPGGRGSAQGAAVKTKDGHASHWAFLFQSLRIVVDEIYRICEDDESVVECKEMIMRLDQYAKDFKSLIERLDLMKAFENAKEGSRPTSLAWEVRKSSPGKSLSVSHGRDGFVPSPTVVRSLTFAGANCPRGGQGSMVIGGLSWADRVRGVKIGTSPGSPAPSNQATVSTQPDTISGVEKQNLDGNATDNSGLPKERSEANVAEEIEDENKGWEPVQRAGKVRARPLSACVLLAEDNRGTYEFKRSLSAVAVETQSGSSVPLGNQSANSLNALNVLTAVRSSLESIIERKTSPAGSDKENVPVNVVSGSSTNQVQRTSQKTTETTTANPAFGGKVDISALDADSKAKEVLVSEAEDASQQQNFTAKGKKRATGSSDEDADGEYEDEDDENMADLDALEKAEEEELESVIQEEATYLQAIAREESLEIYVETEPDTEVECDQGLNSSQADFSASADEYLRQLEEESELLKGTSWGDLVEEAESRIPGRVVHMHEKLSSPSRKKSTIESKKQQEEKQAKAQELRERLNREKGERLRLLTNRVEEIRAKKEEILQKRRVTMDEKLKLAEEKRQFQLQMKVRKAHEEENKLNEIVFINTLEAQNKQHDIMSKHQQSEARLQDIQEERQRKHEEKAAKEAAAEERRRVLEAQKQSRLQEKQELRRRRETEYEQRQIEKEKERLEQARAKERFLEERRAAMSKLEQAQREERQKKLQQRQDETDRRHKEQLEAKQEKAFRMSILGHSAEDQSDLPPKLVPYEKNKFCHVCNVMIPSEVFLLSHLRGKKHQQALSESSNGQELSKLEIENFNLKHISDIPPDKSDLKIASDKERHKALKKRCKKLRLRMAQRGVDYEKALAGRQLKFESENKTKLQKVVRDLQKCIQVQSAGPWPQNKVSSFERSLGEIGRLVEKRANENQIGFCVYGGLATLCDSLKMICQPSSDLPPVIQAKTVVHACTIMKQACSSCYENCQYLLLTNKICFMVDLLVDHLNLLIPDNLSLVMWSSSGTGSLLKLPSNPVTTALADTLAAVLTTIAKAPAHGSAAAQSAKPSTTMSMSGDQKVSNSCDMMVLQNNDVVSYIISIGIIDKLSVYFNNVRGPVDSDESAAEFLQTSLTLITALIGLTCQRCTGTFEKKKLDDPTQLIVTLQVTQFVGILSMMYGMLLHGDAPARGDVPPPPLPRHTLSIALMGFNMLNHVAQLDLHLLQSTLGDEGTSLEFRHISSYLLWYCHHHGNEELLHEVILCIGFFSVNNHDNQIIIQSGQSPTILQQLCCLPFQYFSDVRLMTVLYPTLVSCCFKVERNREILEQELSCACLANFVEKELEKRNNSTALSSSSTSKQDRRSDVNNRMSLELRFPANLWSEALEYFGSKR